MKATGGRNSTGRCPLSPVPCPLSSVPPAQALLVLLVTNLVHRLILVPALVQPVRAVEDDALDRTDVLVGVDHARRDDQAERGGVPDDLDFFPPVGRRLR